MKKLVGSTTEEETPVADASPYPDSNRDTGDAPPSTPRWVKVFGIVFIGLVLLFVILHLAGYGRMNHTPGGNTPPARIIEDGGHTPSVEHAGQQP